MPAYNADDTIELSIQSLRSCGTTDFELIVIDDGSNTPVEPLVKRAAEGMYWRCIRGSENRGIATAGNLAIALAQGKYIARLDADDICVNDRMQKQVDFLESTPQVAFCGTHYQCFGGSDQFRLMPTTVEACVGGLAVGCQFANSSTMIHRERAGGELYYDPTMASEDYDLWLRLCMAGSPGLNLPILGLMYRVSPGSYVSNFKKKTNMNDFSIRMRAMNYLIETGDRMSVPIIASALSAGSPFGSNDIEYCSAVKMAIDECVPKENLIKEWRLFVDYCNRNLPANLPKLTKDAYANWKYKILSSTQRFRHSA